MKLLNKYKNGNAFIHIYDDGTRVIDYPDEEELNVEYPLSIDLCITKYCNRNCPFCYANCNSNGKHGDIMNLKIIESMVPGEEVAIGGGSATSHPDLKRFLIKLKNKGLIASMTVSQGEFLDNLELINDLIEENLINGLGISFKEENDVLWKQVADNENCVVHLIAGIHTKETFDYLSKFGLKVLILGYKDVGRGYFYHDALRNITDKNISWLKNNLKTYFSNFKVISFDNLALKQLNPKNLIAEEEWKEAYQGSDGTISCYIDAVEGKMQISSLNNDGISLSDDIKNDFSKIKKMAKEGKDL